MLLTSADISDIESTFGSEDLVISLVKIVDYIKISEPDALQLAPYFRSSNNSDKQVQSNQDFILKQSTETSLKI